jgi:hypothetical protein
MEYGTIQKNYKPYRFTLLEDRDKEIIEFLDSIPKTHQGVMILKGLKLLIKTCMSRTIEEIVGLFLNSNLSC